MLRACRGLASVRLATQLLGSSRHAVTRGARRCFAFAASASRQSTASTTSSLSRDVLVYRYHRPRRFVVIFVVTTIAQAIMSWPLVVSWFLSVTNQQPPSPPDPWSQAAAPKQKMSWYHWILSFGASFSVYAVIQVLRRRRIAEIIMEADRKYCRFGYHTFWGGMTYRRLPISYVVPRNATKKNLIVRVRGDYLFPKHFIARRKGEVLDVDLLAAITGFALPRVRTQPSIQATFNAAQKIQEARASREAAKQAARTEAGAAAGPGAVARPAGAPAASATAPDSSSAAVSYVGRRSRINTGKQ